MKKSSNKETADERRSRLAEMIKMVEAEGRGDSCEARLYRGALADLQGVTTDQLVSKGYAW